ncbi:MAG: histidine phosphatase family protein [Acidimicrobiia bacterium]
MTIRLTLVRHARPDGTWGLDPDPGLDRVGRDQAEAMAEAIGGRAPVPVVVSPLRRTRETAAPLLARWGIEAVVEPAVGELTAPLDPRPDHATWLRALMAGRGADHAGVMAPFRSRVLGAIRALRTDTVVVTHFLAINAVVGAATDDDRVVCFTPGHCSVTTVVLDGDALSVVQLGADGPGAVRL